jgi:DNA-binding IscR family transcriptional regulator
VDDVLVAVEGRRLAEKRCILGHQECDSLAACPLHEHWTQVRNQFDTTVGTLTIRELAAYEARK